MNQWQSALATYIANYKHEIQKTPHSINTQWSKPDQELYMILSLLDEAAINPDIQAQLSYIFNEDSNDDKYSTYQANAWKALFTAMDSITEKYRVITTVFDNFQELFSHYDWIEQLKKEIELHPDLIKDSGDEIHGLHIGVPAECAFDKVRTLKIFDAIYNWLLKQKNSWKKEVSYIDMGTGTGILAYAIYHIAKELWLVVKIIAIEYNKETYAMATELLAKDTCNHSIELLNIDGTKIWEYINTNKIDGYVSENLCSGNTTEMSNELFQATQQYLSNDAVVIPRGIHLSTYLSYIEREVIESSKWDEASPYTFSQRRSTTSEGVLSILQIGNKDTYNNTQYIPTADNIMEEILINYTHISTKDNEKINSIILEMNVFFGASTYSELEPNTATALGNNMICSLPNDIILQKWDTIQVQASYLPGASEKDVYNSIKIYVNNDLLFANWNFVQKNVMANT